MSKTSAARAGAQNAPWNIVEAEFVAAAQQVASLPEAPLPEIAFAGRSNVGKSSLLNALMGRRKLVRTSSTPGCTRQINFFSAKSRDARTFGLVDLPGYGYAQRSKTERAEWGRLIEHYLHHREALVAVALLIDARRGFGEDDEQLLDFIRQRPQTEENALNVTIVATKVDKIAKSKRKSAMSKLRSVSGVKVIGVSAVNGEGIERLWSVMRGW